MVKGNKTFQAMVEGRGSWPKLPDGWSSEATRKKAESFPTQPFEAFMRTALQGVNSDVNTAPFKLGMTADIFKTFRLDLSIHTVCLSASLSAATISTL